MCFLFFIFVITCKLTGKFCLLLFLTNINFLIFSLHTAHHKVNIKTHSEIAHQYGAFKIFLLMTSGEMGQ